MKKILALAVIFALSCALLAGCGPAAATDTTTPTTVAPSTASGNNPDGPQEPDVNDPDAPGAPERPDGAQRVSMSAPDVQGVVSSVVGNEITLKLIEPQEAMMFGSVIEDGTLPDGTTIPEDFTIPEGFEPGEGGRAFNGELPEGFSLPEGFEPGEGGQFVFDGEMPEGFSLPEGGSMPRRGGSFSGGMADVELEVTYTGEEITVSLPVGLEISSGMSAISGTDLSKRQILSIWYDEENPNKIVRASVAGKASS